MACGGGVDLLLLSTRKFIRQAGEVGSTSFIRAKQWPGDTSPGASLATREGVGTAIGKARSTNGSGQLLCGGHQGL